jgi:hypothetical protein
MRNASVEALFISHTVVSGVVIKCLNINWYIPQSEQRSQCGKLRIWSRKTTPRKGVRGRNGNGIHREINNLISESFIDVHSLTVIKLSCLLKFTYVTNAFLILYCEIIQAPRRRLADMDFRPRLQDTIWGIYLVKRGYETIFFWALPFLLQISILQTTTSTAISSYALETECHWTTSFIYFIFKDNCSGRTLHNLSYE